MSDAAKAKAEEEHKALQADLSLAVARQKGLLGETGGVYSAVNKGVRLALGPAHAPTPESDVGFKVAGQGPGEPGEENIKATMGGGGTAKATVIPGKDQITGTMGGSNKDTATATLKHGDKTDDVTATQQADPNKKPKHLDPNAPLSDSDPANSTQYMKMVYAHADDKSDIRQEGIDISWYNALGGVFNFHAELPYPEFIMGKCNQVAIFANMSVEHNKFGVEAKDSISKIVQMDDNKDVLAFAKENGISKNELNEIRKHKPPGYGPGSSAIGVGGSSSAPVIDKEAELKKAEAEKAYEEYLSDLAAVVAKRRLIAKYMEEFYPDEKRKKDNDFLFGDIQPKNDDDLSFKVQQILNLMQLYLGATMEQDKTNPNDFKMKYFDPELGKEVTLVTGSMDPNTNKITIQASVNGKNWDRALLQMVDQRKRMMGHTRDDRHFPILGTAHPEKMVRLYQLAMLNNMKPTLNEEQITHIRKYDQSHGTDYGEKLLYLMKIKVETWGQESVAKEMESLSPSQRNSINTSKVVSGKGKAIVLAEHRHLVDKLQDWHVHKQDGEFKEKNMGKTPEQLGKEAKELEKAKIEVDSSPAPAAASASATTAVIQTPKPK